MPSSSKLSPEAPSRASEGYHHWQEPANGYIVDGAISIEALRGCHAAAASGWNDCFGCMQGDTLVHGAYKGRAGVRTDAEAGL